MATVDSATTRNLSMPGSAEIVEIPLLLPASWADALIELSKRRRQSIAQILRGLIDQALLDGESDEA